MQGAGAESSATKGNMNRPIGEQALTDTKELKHELVDCIRILKGSDIIDYNGHARMHAGDNRMLINIGSCQRSRLTTADINHRCPDSKVKHLSFR